MISTARQRADFYTRKEQEARLQIRERTEELADWARRIIDSRIKRYPKGMRRHYESFVEQMFQDLRDEDLARKKMIDDQQHFLRLASFYETRAQGEREG